MKCTVSFLPDKKTVEVHSGETILSAAISAGIFLNSSCGGEGVCGRCKVIVKKGRFHMEPTGKISKAELNRGYCLACLATIEGDLEVKIPKETRLDLGKAAKLDADYHLKGLFSKSQDIELVKLPTVDKLECPLVQKFYLELEAPTLDDSTADLERIFRQLKTQYGVIVDKTSLSNIRRLPETLRSSDWKITTIIDCAGERKELIAVEAGDTSKSNYGISVDIGTTTVSVQLIDLIKGVILGTKTSYNRQAAFGADVISRIIFAQEPYGLERLHHAVVETIDSMITDLMKESKIHLNDIYCVYCAANTTMTHLLLKINPASIRREPYVAVASFAPAVKASDVGIRINPAGILKCSPCVSSYVGGDITAGVYASGMTSSEEVSMFIDIGTNGEIVLGNRDWLVCCAASAGPAFEGSGMTNGMRAVKGSIQNVKINKENLSVEISVIGGIKPIGICGSGYIDLLSEMLKAGVMDKSGKINVSAGNSNTRVRNGISEFVVVHSMNSGIKKDIVISDVDIENLKRAKAAIFSASFILAKHMNLAIEDIKHFYIAGGFGTFLDIQKAISIGLLPNLAKDKFQYLGNTSLAGARRALLAKDAREQINEFARKMTYFELSVDPKYMDEYMAALFFPHTNTSRFIGMK